MEQISASCSIDCDDRSVTNFIASKGLIGFLRVLTEKNLSDISTLLGLPDPFIQWEGDIVNLIADEIMLGGGESCLKALSKEILVDFGNQLRVGKPADLAQDALVDALMVQIFELEPVEEFEKLLKGKKTSSSVVPNKKKRPREESVDQDSDHDSQESKNKKQKHVSPPLSDIKKGISKAELHDKYNLADLQNWCKANEVSHQGKKSIVIKNIYEFLETGKKKEQKATKKKRKAAS